MVSSAPAPWSCSRVSVDPFYSDANMGVFPIDQTFFSAMPVIMVFSPAFGRENWNTPWHLGNNGIDMQKILIVEDDVTIVRALREYLSNEGFEVVVVSGQQDAVKVVEEGKTDLLLIDISLTDGDGFTVCEAAKGRGLPSIFLTASGDENSVVRGLDMGADDYISKPFRPRELVSRIRSVLRRSGRAQRVVLLGNVSVDAEKGIVTKEGVVVPLSALEFRLLMAFVNNRGRLLSRNTLLEEIWDAGGDFVNDNTLTVYIKRLRQKIENDPQKPEIIKTVRGLGYRVD